MRMRRLAVFLVLLAAMFVSAAEAAPAGIKEFTPTGNVSDNVEFRMVFNSPVVEKKQVGKSVDVDEFPFEVTPEIQAEGKWTDQKTFVASLLAPLEMGTAYKAKVKKDLADLSGKKIGSGTFAFQTEGLELESVKAVNVKGDYVSLQLNFNIPVIPARLKGFMSVQDEEGKALNYNISSNAPSKTMLASFYNEKSGEVRKFKLQLAAGLTGVTGKLGLSEAVSRSFTVKPVLLVDGFEVQDGNIVLRTNFILDVKRAKDFISIEPSVPFETDLNDSNYLRLKGSFNPRDRFVLTVKKGMPTTGGLPLAQEFKQSVIVPDKEPSIKFLSFGTFLSPADGGRIPLELVNVKKLKVDLWRLYENNVPFVLRSDYDGFYFRRELARRVYSKEFDTALPLNETARRALSVAELSGGARGLFQLTVRDQAAEYWDEESQIINLSDMGLVVRIWEDGMLAWVNTLSSTQPIAGATVRIYSSANQVIAEGKTDADGVCLVQLGEPWSYEEGNAPSLAIASLNDDISFVRLNRDLLSQEMFDTAGRPWLKDGYDAMIFSARDIYRTGETVNFKTIVRNADISTPAPFPVLFSIHDPLGRMVKKETAKLSEEGGAGFVFELSSSAMTGLWEVRASIPGKEDEPMARMSFNVEDFAPPRIDVELKTEDKYMESGSEVALDIAARYVFGVDGAGLKWEGSWYAKAEDFKPTQDRWKGYTFGDYTREFSPFNGELGDGVLDEKGNAQASFSFDDDVILRAPSIIKMTFDVAVMEDGGRWVHKAISMPCYPTPWLLGIAAPNEALAVGRDLSFKVAAIDPEENPADPGELNAVVERVSWNYNLVNIDGYTRWQWSEEYKEVTSSTLTLKDGVGQVTFKPEKWGTYIIRIADENDEAKASYRFYADDPKYAEQGGSQLLDRVEVALDKEQYKVGETAKVTLRAPYEGLILFNVEGQGILLQKTLKVTKAETVVEVPVTDKMIPNAWCAAWLIRPVVEEESWGAHRAIGVARLKADISSYKLDVAMEAPEKAEPAVKLPVTMTLKDSDGKPVQGEVTVALVDDAVLGLTNFKTPDLLNYFWGLREMNSAGYDLYDYLIPIESKTTQLLRPGGDMAAMLDAFAGNKAQRFKILSMFEGTVVPDANGVIKIDLDVPEFSGRGRLFAVAASGTKFGMAEQKVQIARTIVTEADLPRFAAPGDVFSANFSVFNSSEEDRDVKVELTSEGGLEVKESNMTFKIKAKGSARASVEVKATVPGTAVWNVKTSWSENGADKSFLQTIELPVRSPWAITARSGGSTFEAGSTSVQIPLKEFTGKLMGSLSFSDSPVVDLTSAVTYLLNYPYGCLEQTVSTIWPFLTIPEAVAKIDPLLVNDESVKRKLEDSMLRIQTMQLYDGSFSFWPGGSEPYYWGSVYAAHFLTEARKAGVSYPEDMFKGVMNWLKGYLASMPENNYEGQEKDDFTTKAYAAYVLALNGEKPLGWIQYLGENKSIMWPSGQIWLAGAAALVDGRPDALRELGLGGKEKFTAEARYRTLDSAVRNTAQLLSMWMEVEPSAGEAMELVSRLLKYGKENRWYSTQENSAVTMALGRYVLKAGNEKAELEGELKDSEQKTLLTFKSGQASSVNVADLTGESLNLDLKGTGKGYYSWTIMGTPSSEPKPEQKGLKVDCSWMNEKGEPLDPSKPILQGQRIQISMTITPTVYVGNLVLSCLLPAGFEIENPRLLKEGEYFDSPVRTDARDDRLLLFIDRLEKPMTYNFLARAVTKGTFALPPITAQGMYDPEVSFVGKTLAPIVIK